MGCQYFDPCDHGADTFTIAIPKVTFGRGCLGEAGARAQDLGILCLVRSIYCARAGDDRTGPSTHSCCFGKMDQAPRNSVAGLEQTIA